MRILECRKIFLNLLEYNFKLIGHFIHGKISGNNIFKKVKIQRKFPKKKKF